MDTKINHKHSIFGFMPTFALASVMGVGFGMAPNAATANDSTHPVCNQTAGVLFNACMTDLDEEFNIARANCLNESATGVERSKCTDEANLVRNEGRGECREQRSSRRDVCELIGQERYDPAFNPARFDPNFATQNPLFPLNVGNRWVYELEDQRIVVRVLNQTKLVRGVTCRVVNDRVIEDGKLVEDTNDWYATRVDGSIFYCGEETAEFEVFRGDRPQLPERVNIDGSFKVGREGAEPGIIIEGNPQVGDAYRQEALYGEAEDVGEVLSTNYSFGVNPELDNLVPQALAEALCNNNCLVTREFTPLEPGVTELKYYAPGIGQFLGVEEGAVEKLVECTVNGVPCALPRE